MSEIAAAGIHKGIIIKGSAQYGESKNGNPELILGCLVDDRSYSTVLYFSAEAAPYSIEKLRSAGWKGNDLSDLSSLYSGQPVMFEFSYEIYEGKQRLKVQIFSGGKFETANPVDPKSFAAKVAAITGIQELGGAGAPKPKF